jgi:hypothetical protein
MTDVGEAFVDDTQLGYTTTHTYNNNMTLADNIAAEEADVIAKLQQLSQAWEQLLFATGGALCLLRSFWYILSWRWSKSGIAQPSTLIQAPGTLQLTSGKEIYSPVEIPRIESTASYRTLGIRLSPSGCSDLAVSVLHSQSTEFASRVKNSTLS